MFPLLSPEESKRRAAEVGIREDLASVNAFRSLLNNPKIAGAVGKLLVTLLFEGALDARLRELVILRTGWLSGSEYEYCQHAAVSRRLKISEEDILGVRDPESCRSYNDLDRTVIRLTDELFRGTEISPETWSALSKAFDTPQLIELLAVTANWRFFALYLKAAAVPLDEGVLGWPEGRAPSNKG